jgi:hypothetical protein
VYVTDHHDHAARGVGGRAVVAVVDAHSVI